VSAQQPGSRSSPAPIREFVEPQVKELIVTVETAARRKGPDRGSISRRFRRH
jgi:hypothetical protein